MKFKGLGILIKDTLIISDLHIGYEEALNRQGVYVPRLHFQKQKKALLRLLLKTKPKTVVINGDLKHEFGRINKQEWKDVLEIIDLIQKKAKLIIIEGNHDVFLKFMKGRNVILKDYVMVHGVYVCHGNKIPKNKDFEKAKTVVIGHEHPAISLHDDRKSEKYKCFLKAKYEKKTVYVIPSFNFLNEGSDITKDRIFSPFLKKCKTVEVFIPHEDEILDFGKIKVNQKA